MARKFDLVAIGTGTAAASVALACREAGLQVAVADSRPFGGTCALRGCEPKKVLVDAAEAVDWVLRMSGKGISAKALQIEWPDLMRFKRSFTDPFPERREESFAKAGVACFHGHAYFADRTRICVAGEVLEGEHILIAAGAKPAKLGILGEELLVTSEEFLNLNSLPKRIVFVGGYISFEFAHIAARAGADATILHRGPKPLAQFDPDLVDLLVQRSRELGVKIEVQTGVEGVEKSNGEFIVHASSGTGKRTYKADLVVHGAGRVPDVENLRLSEADVEWDSRQGVRVNQYLQSVSNPNVYAAGDVIRSGGFPLTPVAGYDGEIVAANLLRGNHRTPDYRGVPTVAFTIPPVASVGLHENTAREHGLRFRKNFAETANWNFSRRVGESCSGHKVLIEEGSERILGAHLLGPKADELVNLFALAIRLEIPATQWKEILLAFPTRGSDFPYML